MTRHVARRRAPVKKRIYLTGQKPAGYEVLVKDNTATETIYTIDAPSYLAGNAIVRALRELDRSRGTIF